MKEATKDMRISELLTLDNGVVPILMDAGLHCLGCPSAQLETLEEACEVHYINCDELITKLNDYLKTV